MFMNGFSTELICQETLRSAFETASSQTGATKSSCESPGIVAAIAKATLQLQQQSPATTTTSTISTADLSFISPLSSVPFHLKSHNNAVDKQLTHVSATSFDVALPSISDLVAHDQLQGMSRLRATLRKTQAIEDDDHLATVTTQESSVNNLAPPNHNLQPCQTSSFEDDDAYLKPSVTSLSLTANNHFPAQPPMAAPVALPYNNGVNHIGETALQLLLQRQIKQESFPQAESILNWTKSGDLFANQLLTLGPLAGLSFPNLVQSHSVDLTSNTDEYRAAAAAAATASSTASGSVSNHSITERKPHSFDMAKFAESRNVHSTESTASTSSEPSFRGSDVPRKSVIQDDIRMGKGRFKLVKKRGRSDVWNLFGQVMDTATGQRLPFVACYACKVLYTDTGGGTGNMTRHRCPLGASYRSIAGSSVETLNESFNANSFESYHGPSPEIDKESPITATLLQCMSQGVSKSFEMPLPQPTTCPQQTAFCRPLQTQVSNLSSVGSISLQASSSSTESAPPGLLSCGSLSLDVPSTPSAPLIQSTTTQLTSNVSPENTLNSSATTLKMEKGEMLKIVAQYCINSFELPSVVNKPSFIKLLEETFSCARRLFPSHQQHADYKSFAELIPTETNLSKFIKQQSNMIRDKLRKHFQTTQHDGIVLICQELRYADRKLMTVWTSFIGNSWEYERICIAVKEDETDLTKILIDVADNYGFTHAPMIYVTLDDSMPVLDRPMLPSNMRYIDNVVQAINEILVNAINESANLSEIIKLINVYQSALNAETELDPQNTANSKFVVKNIINDGKVCDALDLHRLLKQFRISYDSWKQQISLRNQTEMIAEIESVDKMVAHNLESFLEPFFEVTQTLSSTTDLHFHTILPEWHALIHECVSVDDESDYLDLRHVQNPPLLSDRPRRRSLRHQKSIDDEPILQIDDEDSNSAPMCDKKDTWMKSLRKRVEMGLKNWAQRHLGYDHRIATALNPMMRKLPIICTDSERLQTYSKIRQNAGLKKVNENKIDQNVDDYEPQRKRQNFLSKLEDQGMAHDELDNYLNMQIVPQEGRSLTDFWSKAQNLPKLAQYARSVLPMIAAALPIHLRHVTNCSLTDEDLADMLILKTSSLFSDHNQTSGTHRS